MDGWEDSCSQMSKALAWHLFMLLNLLAYLAFDKAPFQSCIWDRILCCPHFGSHCCGCCLEITLRLVVNLMPQNNWLRNRGRQKKAKWLWEYGANSYFSWLILDCLGGLGHTWELPTLALIKRHHHSPALSRTAAGNNTKQRSFPNCLHTCRAVEVSQLATHCLLTMYERKQLKEGEGSQRLVLKFQ